MLVEKVHTIAHVLELPEHTDPVVVALMLSTLLLFESRKTNVVVVAAASAVELTALPLKVSVKVRSIAEPALFAVKVTVARLSTEDFTRPELVPNAVALGVSTVRRTVIWLPAALPERVAAALELAPNAVTEDVAIWKVEVELSVAPCEAYVATSPFRVTVTELDLGTKIGTLKWNA